MTALLVGFGMGLFVGAQPGPVSLLCIRSVLRAGWFAGLAIGAGAALVDGLYATSVAATASNPLTIATWAAIFAATSTASVAQVATSTGSSLLMLVGVPLGTLTAFGVLTGLLCTLRHRVGERFLRTVDAVAGTGLLGFAGLLGLRTAHEA